VRHLAVIGAGISGLAAATVAAERASAVAGGLTITVYEREAAVGGKAVSVAEDGWLVETGPTGFLDNEPALDRLVAAAGLAKLPADAAAARRFVVRGERMREIRPHPLKFAASGILGPLGLARLALEPLVPARRDPGEESVWAFAERRLGRQAAERLIAPMVLGVFAGEARELSLAAAFPRLAELEREHGSLVRGLIARRRAGRSGGGPAGPAGTLTSFADGLQSLPRALAARGAFAVHGARPVEAIERAAGGGWRLRAGGESVHADAVVLAGEPWAMATLLPPEAGEAAEALAAIPCPPVVLVALGFGAQALARVPRGFGVLIPREAGYRILGSLWDTFLFPGRSPDGHLLVRAMLGGAVDPQAAELSSEELVAITRADLARLLGIDEPPLYQRVVRWPRAIPQYELGHLERVARIEAALGAAPGLLAAGNALHGIAFGKAAAAGVAAGEAAIDYLRKA